jgi:hypothetical protein
MFMKSAASDTLQGRAMQAINERWGEGRWCGRETIGIAVCKKKYAPFSFCVETGPAGKVVKVERMFGCHCHSDIRREKIEMRGVRKGWEPFGQWSMRKAQELARRETERINGVSSNVTTTKLEGDDPQVVSSDEEPKSMSNEELKSMCNNGKCTWKMKEKYDNVYREITGDTSDED